MANTIRHKRSSVPGSMPQPSDLFLGELALNTADGKLFTKKSDGTVIDLTTSGDVDGGELVYNSLLEGLMSFWIFDNSVGHVADVSGNGKSLYEAFSTRTVQGKVGNALRLDKGNFYYSEDAFVGHKTISMWIRSPSFKGVYSTSSSYSVGDIASNSGSLWVLESPLPEQNSSSSSPSTSPDSNYWKSLGPAEGMNVISVDSLEGSSGERVYFGLDGKLNWLAKIGSGNATVSTSSALPDQWRHIVLVYDQSSNLIRLYENGQQTDSEAVSGSAPSDNSLLLFLGLRSKIPLDIDCVGIWSRALTAVEIGSLYGSGSGYEFEAPMPPQIDYEQFVTINVSGDVSSLTASIVGNSNSIHPSFNQEIHDYAILTNSVPAGTSVSYSVTVNGTAYPGVSAVGKLIRITNGTDDYYVRLLPSDMPIGTVTTQPGDGYVPGYYISTSRRDINVNNYNIVYDENGVPVWYVQNAGTPHLAQHGNDRNKVGVSRNGTGTRYSMEITNDSINTNAYDFLPTVRNGNTYQYNFGNHEFLEVKSPPEHRGNVIYNTFVAQPTAGSQALADKAYGVYIQEQTPDNTIGWEWWTSDRFDRTALARNASFFHMNSVDIHPITGDMLLSCRQCSAVVCVDRSTKDVKWVIQGSSQPWGGIQQTANQHTLDNAKWLTLEGEPELQGYQYLGPEGQHHARWAINVNPLTPGNDVVAIFDNQAGFFPGSTNSPKTVTALSQSGTLVTGTATAHGFTNGSYVKVAGANQSLFNGVFLVTVVNPNTFTYTVSSSGTMTASGTITAQRAQTYWPHSANSPAARGVIYEIDLANNKAIHRASAFAPNGRSGYLGSYQIMLHDDGSFSHVLNFTQQHPPLVEYGDAGDGASPGEIIFAVDFPGDIYRITKVPKDYFDLNYLRATAGLAPNILN